LTRIRALGRGPIGSDVLRYEYPLATTPLAEASVRANFERKGSPSAPSPRPQTFDQLPSPPPQSHTKPFTVNGQQPTQSQLSTSSCDQLNSFAMESLLRQGKQVCPFLKRNTPATLRMLATSLHTTKRGYKVSGLQNAAAHCPVIGKAIATQQAKRPYVTKTEPVAVARSAPNHAESVSIAEAHRAAGVTDLSKGSDFSLLLSGLTCD
jgi:hypothetical protein